MVTFLAYLCVAKGSLADRKTYGQGLQKKKKKEGKKSLTSNTGISLSLTARGIAFIIDENVVIKRILQKTFRSTDSQLANTGDVRDLIFPKC